MNGVIWRAAGDCGAPLQDLPQARGGAQPASGQAEATKPSSSFEGQPKADERAKGKGEEDRVSRTHTGHAQNLLPIAEHPLPTLRGVQPAQWSTGGSAGLVVADVSFEWIRQVGPEKRRRALILNNLGFRGEWNRTGELLQRGDPPRSLCGIELVRIKLIGRKQRLP